jgi:endonuclease/exonuclease/phosphatase family metal-dependent hydrolase
MSHVDIKEFSVTATITNLIDNSIWTVTGVYGPQEEAAKQQFLQELRQIKPAVATGWILMGDFNLIYRACDKSNSQVNRRLISASWAVLEDLEIKELQLHGRCFTWSSGTANPTLSKIDHVFVSKEWELFNPHCYLQALSSSVSDHCPLLITCTPFAKRYKGFRFEAS